LIIDRPKAKTKVVSPEDVIPLEKDSHQFWNDCNLKPKPNRIPWGIKAQSLYLNNLPIINIRFSASRPLGGSLFF
jgi:hypothetical protein